MFRQQPDFLLLGCTTHHTIKNNQSRQLSIMQQACAGLGRLMIMLEGTSLYWL